MTKHKDLGPLVQAGQARRDVPMTRKELLQSVADMFKQRANERFDLLIETEHMTEDALRALPTAGTVLGAVEQHLGSLGATTDGTVGGVMNVLGTDPDAIHEAVCYCHTHSVAMDGHTAAYRFGELAKKA